MMAIISNVAMKLWIYDQTPNTFAWGYFGEQNWDKKFLEDQ